MQVGLTMFVTDETIGPVALGRAAEERGFESVLLPEHTHIPAGRQTPYPGGGELPREYARSYDPFVALAAIAAVTTTLRIGTGICLVVERDPLVTAKEVASLDHLSGGRFLFGVGMGWNREEMRNHGTDPATRAALLADRVAAMKAVWTQDEASHTGPFTSFERVWSWPKPVQRPHPPVLVGGSGPSAADRLVAYGDEWFPINRGDDTTFAAQAAEVQTRWRDAGRGDAVPISLYAATPRPEALERYAELGVTRAVLLLRPEPADDTLRRLDRWAAALL